MSIPQKLATVYKQWLRQFKNTRYQKIYFYQRYNFFARLPNGGCTAGFVEAVRQGINNGGPLTSTVGGRGQRAHRLNEASPPLALGVLVNSLTTAVDPGIFFQISSKCVFRENLF